ncbi:MAG: Eco57I restriction-modification methylase domain-containing protein, partial [Eubacterium sp.]|nr:Eco57I restriction-modification methylase domain-containing protein [Eubacterium sp.]
MHFDFAIGNPPYQDDTIGDNATFKPPIYNIFMDAAYEVADKVELIHPARFLFNAGNTPKPWNNKMLTDNHFKVLEYEPDSSKIFSNTDIKGGVVVSYRDKDINYGAIETFTAYEELNNAYKKVEKSNGFTSLSTIVSGRTAYRLTQKLHDDYPNAKNQLSKGHAFDMSSNIFERLPQVFYDDKPKDENEYIKILGLSKKQRVYK